MSRFRRYCLYALIATFIVGALVYYWQSYAFTYFVSDHQIIRLVLKENFLAQPQQTLLVEVVKTNASLTEGLANRSSLSTTSGQQLDGMLFIFPQKERQSFWMKGMLFNIDLCWLDHLKLLSCLRDLPVPFVDSNLTIYQSPISSNLVLETRVGLLTEIDLPLKLFFKW